MKATLKLELDEARTMVRAVLQKAGSLRVAETVCVVDDGGYPLAMERMNGARVTGPQIAWNKATWLMIAAARKAFALHGADGGYIYADSFTFQADAR